MARRGLVSSDGKQERELDTKRWANGVHLQKRKELSPNKLPAGRWVEIITTAHELGIPTTSTMMYGHVEEPADWVRHMLLLRAIQKRTGGFTEFVPLGFIHENTRLYRHGGARPGAKREEHLRVHALARVLLH